ncbi:MAG: porin family protein [Ferruginibacter sp.]
MKKKILPLLFVAISATTFAQTKLSYGFRFGVSSADMRGDAVQSLKDLVDFADKYITTGPRTSFFTGAYVGLPLGDVITVEPGLYYSQKGYQLKGSLSVKGVDILGVNAKAQLQLNYLELPLLLKANMGGLQIFAGPQISYLMNADLKASAGALGFNVFSTKIPVGSQFNKWDAGVTSGIGYQFNNGLNIMASYDYGLSKVDANKNVDAYNRMMKIGIGLNF